MKSILNSHIFKLTALTAAMVIILSLMKLFGVAGLVSTGFITLTTTPAIRWLSFDVPYGILTAALGYDIDSQQSNYPIDWISLLAYTAARGYGNFDNNSMGHMQSAVARIQDGEDINDIADGLNKFDYFMRAYGAVLSGFVGMYEIITDEGAKRQYGLRVFSPIPKNFYYEHFDDFGNPRDYGYRRRHLGHDLFGEIGIPIIAIEDGIIEALGWNQYGGWRIGIRSLDNRRYFYYAHLRRDRPFANGLEIGMRVNAGDVIGFLGRSGYSTRENVDNISVPHLHLGLQIIFEGNEHEIWVDIYNLVRLLNKNRMPVYRDEDGEYQRSLNINNFPDY